MLFSLQARQGWSSTDEADYLLYLHLSILLLPAGRADVKKLLLNLLAASVHKHQESYFVHVQLLPEPRLVPGQNRPNTYFVLRGKVLDVIPRSNSRPRPTAPAAAAGPFECVATAVRERLEARGRCPGAGEAVLKTPRGGRRESRTCDLGQMARPGPQPSWSLALDNRIRPVQGHGHNDTRSREVSWRTLRSPLTSWC